MSEPREPLPDTPSDLAATVKALLEQSRRYQEGMERIHADLHKLHIRIAALHRPAKDDPKGR